MFIYFKCLLSAVNVIKKISNLCGSYINSPEWIKNEKAIINPINKKDNKCFQYAVKYALNH